MVVATVRCCAGGQTRPWQDRGGTRRGQPERPGSYLPGGTPCFARRGKEVAGQPGVRGGGRRRDWLTAFPAGRSQTRNNGSIEAVHGRVHAIFITRPRRPGDNLSRRKRRSGTGTGFQRRALGT